MPSDQVQQMESSVSIVRITKELRQRANWFTVITRHNPVLGIMSILGELHVVVVPNRGDLRVFDGVAL